MKHKPKHKPQTVHIISGELRHRHIVFIAAENLRPTSARIRETLFNWLQPVIAGKTCLDLFAGSGILGVEAISRGAKQVTFVEKNRQVARQIKENIKLLNIANATVIKSDYQQALSGQYDIIFLDPPYNFRLLPDLLEQVLSLAPQWIFIEDNQPFDTWITQQQYYELVKSKKAGNIYYGLLQPIQA